MTTVVSRALIAASVVVGVMSDVTAALARPVNLSVGGLDLRFGRAGLHPNHPRIARSRSRAQSLFV